MKFIRRFRMNAAWRITLLALTIMLAFYFFFRGQEVPGLLLAAAAICQIYAFIRYVDRSNRGLTRFLQAVRYGDFSLTAGIDGLGSSFDDLNAAFREISDRFQHAREEKEAQYRYLQTVIQHIGVGLLSLRADGAIDLLNNAAKRLLRVSHLHRIQDLPPALQPLCQEILRLGAGEKSLIRLDFPDEPVHVSIFATEFKLRDKFCKLVSLQNIQLELEEKEAEAWQSLTRVLTHEIMNSLTPIASLAATASGLLAGNDQAAQTADIATALQTIDKRSQGLMRFVQAYRHLTLIPKPKFTIFPVMELFQRVEQLMRGKLDHRGIAFACQVEPRSLELTADPDMTEQVLINLLLNAVEAVSGRSDPRIDLSANLNDRGRVVIQVSDNGPGISAEAREKIFIPFFTTKKEGSGIGLSFSRQVMRLHRGAISIHSQPGDRTTFTLRF